MTHFCCILNCTVQITNRKKWDEYNWARNENTINYTVLSTKVLARLDWQREQHSKALLMCFFQRGLAADAVENWHVSRDTVCTLAMARKLHGIYIYREQHLIFLVWNKYKIQMNWDRRSNKASSVDTIHPSAFMSVFCCMKPTSTTLEHETSPKIIIVGLHLFQVRLAVSPRFQSLS